VKQASVTGLALTPFILQKSRMRRRARTDLCGGAISNGRPYRDNNKRVRETSVLPTIHSELAISTRVSVAFMLRLAFLCCLGVLLFDLTGCRGHSNVQEMARAEPYISDPNSVEFDISPLPGNDGSRQWLATYSGQNKTAKFRIVIGPPVPMNSEKDTGMKMSSSSGAILAVPNSDSSTMLAALAKALEANMSRLMLKEHHGSLSPMSFLARIIHKQAGEDSLKSLRETGPQ
jgi:hypothetical protein